MYIYPPNSDSGGKIWTNFISVLLPCLLIAQFTSKFTRFIVWFTFFRTNRYVTACLVKVVGLLALKQSVVATPMMIPLIVITILFNAYLRQQHFRVAEYLPSRECLKADLTNGPDFDLSFTKDAYLQGELREKHVNPENLSEERMRELGLTNQAID